MSDSRNMNIVQKNFSKALKNYGELFKALEAIARNLGFPEDYMKEADFNRVINPTEKAIELLDESLESIKTAMYDLRASDIYIDFQ